MNKYFLLLICFTFTLIIGKEVTTSTRWPKVILMGDSLTQLSFSIEGRWGSLISDRLSKQADVLNRGFGGFTTITYDRILDESMIGSNNETTAVVTLLLGTNDANTGSSGHVILPDYEKYLKKILNRLFYDYEISSDKMILMCPPPTTHESIKTETYAILCNEIGNKLNITVINLYPIFSQALKEKNLFIDGIHFSTLGSQLVFDNLWPLVEDKFKKYQSNN